MRFCNLFLKECCQHLSSPFSPHLPSPPSHFQSFPTLSFQWYGKAKCEQNNSALERREFLELGTRRIEIVNTKYSFSLKQTSPEISAVHQTSGSNYCVPGTLLGCKSTDGQPLPICPASPLLPFWENKLLLHTWRHMLPMHILIYLLIFLLPVIIKIYLSPQLPIDWGKQYSQWSINSDLLHDKESISIYYLIYGLNYLKHDQAGTKQTLSSAQASVARLGRHQTQAQGLQVPRAVKNQPIWHFPPLAHSHRLAVCHLGREWKGQIMRPGQQGTSLAHLVARTMNLARKWVNFCPLQRRPSSGGF